MREIVHRPGGLVSLSPELSPQVMAWTEELRTQFTALNMSISLFCRLHPIDKGTVSRYLNGKRVPTDRWFLDQVLALRASGGTPVTDDVRAHLVELQMTALKVAHPHEYRVRKVNNELEIAVTSWKEAERYAQSLEHQLTERTRTLQDLRTETERLRAVWDHDRTQYHEEITRLTQQLELARDRVRKAEHRVQALTDFLDQLETQQPTWDEFAAKITHEQPNSRPVIALAEALTVAQVVQVIMNVGRTVLATDRSGMALLDAERATLKLFSWGVPDVLEEPGEEIPLSHSSVMTMAVNSQRPMYAESPESLEAQFVGAGGDEKAIDDFLTLSNERAWVGLPLLAAGRTLGALRFAFTHLRKFSQEDRAFLEALAGQCAIAVERATLFEREHRIAETSARVTAEADPIQRPRTC